VTKLAQAQVKIGLRFLGISKIKAFALVCKKAYFFVVLLVFLSYMFVCLFFNRFKN